MNAAVLLGGPGAGKGTLAGILCERSGWVHVSTGDILRDAIRKKTDVGLKARQFMDAGELVPDQVILELIDARIKEGQQDGLFLFDGFPRTVEQAAGLEHICRKHGVTLSHVFCLNVDRSVLIQRLSGRRICRTCGAVYHVVNMPPVRDGVCDVDGDELIQRPDDREEAVLNRLEVYQKQTAPLISWYREKGLLRDIDAGGAVEQTVSAVDTILSEQPGS